MKNDWILDVLNDLKAFAQQNGMTALAEQLDDTTLVAAGELVSAKGSELETAVCDERKTGSLHRLYSSG